MSGDTLDQHRRELDAHFETLQTVREYLAADLEETRKSWRAIEELRDELRALANRVEALTRAVALDTAVASRDAHRANVLDELVVVDLEAELPEVAGTYLDTVEDGVRYLDPSGRDRVAPVDSVRILTRRELRETRRQAGRP